MWPSSDTSTWQPAQRNAVSGGIIEVSVSGLSALVRKKFLTGGWCTQEGSTDPVQLENIKRNDTYPCSQTATSVSK